MSLLELGFKHNPRFVYCESQTQSVLKAALMECWSVESLADLCRLSYRSPCILPAAEKMCSTPAEEAGAAKYCL